MSWSWPRGNRLAFSLVVNVEEGSELGLFPEDERPDPVDELSVALRGPYRNFGNESNYRYGLRAGFPRIAAILERRGIAATWAAAAVSLTEAPEIARFVSDRSDEVCAHGWRWLHQHRMHQDEERTFIRRAAESIEASVGTRPVGWLSRYLHTSETRKILVEEGFQYHMDDYSDDVPRWEAVGSGSIIVLPYALDSNDIKMWVAPGYTPDAWLKYAIDTFDVLYEEAADAPRMMSLGVHLRIIGRPGRSWALDRFLEHVRRRDDVWIATRHQIATSFAEQVPEP